MELPNFTEEERHFMSSYLKQRSGWVGAILSYGPYVLPSVLFAIYAVWKHDFAAALVAYVALLVVAILYLSYSNQYANTFQSILRKYEAWLLAKENEQSHEI